jgi:hypothetical protein
LPPGDQIDRPLPLYQTDLSQVPLPEILVKIHQYRVPGVIECRRGDETKRLYLEDGRIVFATTNQVTESLGDRLVREGKLSQSQYDDSVRHMKVTGMRHGVTLLNMGLLEKEELFAAVRQQLQEIIDSVFVWTTGAVEFTPGRDKEKSLEFVKLEASIPNAIVRGVRRMVDARVLVARLGAKATLLVRTATGYPELRLAPDEERLLHAVDGKRALYELVTSSPDTSLNARLLYAFFALQMIARRESRQVKVQIRTESRVPEE